MKQKVIQTMHLLEATECIYYTGTPKEHAKAFDIDIATATATVNVNKKPILQGVAKGASGKNYNVFIAVDSLAEFKPIKNRIRFWCSCYHFNTRLRCQNNSSDTKKHCKHIKKLAYHFLNEFYQWNESTTKQKEQLCR